MKTTSKLVPCRVAGCLHTPFKHKSSESTHYHRVHSGLVLVKGQKRGTTPAPAENGEHVPIATNGTEAPAQRQTRKYTRRTKLAKKLKPVQIDIHFCPRCILPLHPVAVGMVMAKANSTVNGCPRCGLDLRTVAFGMASKPVA